MCLICILQKIRKSILTKRTFTYLSLIKVWLFCSKLIGMHSVSFLWEKGSSERHKKRQLEPDGILSDRLSIPFYSFCINYQYWTNIFLIDNFRLWSRRKKQSKAFDYYLYMDMQKRFRIDAGNRKSEGKLGLVLHWLKNTNTINICKYKCKNAIQGKISLSLHWLYKLCIKTAPTPLFSLFLFHDSCKLCMIICAPRGLNYSCLDILALNLKEEEKIDIFQQHKNDCRNDIIYTYMVSQKR